MKKITAILALCCALLAGCATGGGNTVQPSPTDPSYAPVEEKVAALKGPTGMGLAWMMSQENAEYSQQKHPGYLYSLSLHGTADEITPDLVSGKLKLACLPVNLAAVLYSKGAGIKLAAVNTLGVLHVVSKGVPVSSLADLAGQTVLSTGKGTTPEYVLSYLLAKNGLDTKVKVEYLSEASEVATRIAAADTAIAVLPEPYVTTVTSKDPAVKVAIDLSVEWDKVSPDSKLVTGALVVQDSFTKDAPEALAGFLSEYQVSIDYTNAHPDEAGAAIAEFGIVPTAQVAAAAIPRSHLTLLTGADAKQAVSGYLQVLYEANPAAVGGSLPGDDFYYLP
ncbi:MAG: ABC transporter substrate-binding protein [Propionibacteriaceae bacterium]|jgi:NitT/TauT family transport system substrate-binding protein|nr:ABC transporter substrate-binding protein [Propionibacteriaceae bacterium]